MGQKKKNLQIPKSMHHIPFSFLQGTLQAKGKSSLLFERLKIPKRNRTLK
jgi:hypothetical protein